MIEQAAVGAQRARQAWLAAEGDHRGRGEGPARARWVQTASMTAGLPTPPHGHELHAVYAEHTISITDRVSHGPDDGARRTMTLTLAQASEIMRGRVPDRLLLRGADGGQSVLSLRVEAQRRALVRKLSELFVDLTFGLEWDPGRHADSIVADVLAGIGGSSRRELAGDGRSGILVLRTEVELGERIRTHLSERLTPVPWRIVQFERLESR